jgi:hypothetical protein
MLYTTQKINKQVRFGYINYSDFTRHNDPFRRKLYLARASNIKGTWRDNPYSPNHLFEYSLELME